MADYRLYVLDSNGHIQSAVELVYESDQEALEAAKAHVCRHGAELWRRDRRIGCFPGEAIAATNPVGMRPTALERAYQLARSGACASVAEIKARLKTEGLDDNQVFGPTLLAELRRLCAAHANAADRSAPQGREPRFLEPASRRAPSWPSSPVQAPVAPPLPRRRSTRMPSP